MSTTDASIYDSGILGTSATGLKALYQRDASMVLSATMDDAVNLGTLTTNQTQLDAKGQISRLNSTHYYAFALDGNSMKMNFTNNSGTSTIRVQVLDSEGTVIADNSNLADEKLQTAYKNLTSEDGLDAEAGDYYLKVTYDPLALKSAVQTYSFGLYSGTRFTQSYQTTTKAQTKETQSVIHDDTLTFAKLDAMEYGIETVHIANETKDDAIDIGWVYENKSALEVNGLINSVAPEQYYTMTLQQGEALKMAFSNHTDTSALRVQIYDSSGTKLLADSHGTEEQQAAYAKLTSSTGLAVDTGTYIIKVSYVDGEPEDDQIYDLKFYSGEYYDTLYTTDVGVESLSNALANGHLVPGYSMKAAAASYLTSLFQGEEIDIMSEISQTI
ncbi:MAG: hypothetical protein AB7E52_02160 [Bdellovibrionales bacterium]